MTKYITVKLTGDQAKELIKLLDNDRVFTDNENQKAFLVRIINKLHKELAKAKKS